MAMTKKEQLIIPEVLKAFVDEKLVSEIKISALADIDNTLVANAGDTLTIPVVGYIGDASILPEGESVTPKQMSTSTRQVKVHKYAQAIQLTDEAVNSSHGNMVNEGAKQLVLSVASAIEDGLYEELRKATLTHSASEVNADTIVDAIVKFGEAGFGEEKFLLVNPAQYAQLRKSADWVAVADGGQIGGEVGMVMNCRVIIADRCEANEMFILRRGGLGIVAKQGCKVESDRDILNFSTVYSVSQHAVPYLKDESKVIKITIA